MQSENRMFDDIVKMVNGAAGTFAGMTREAQESMRERMRDFVGGADSVSRDEFEAIKSIAVAAADRVDALEARLALLEGTATSASQATGAA
jgi:BMFP domain-containing protein YqiC